MKKKTITNPDYWQFVCNRNARDNPRGDFIRDTRRLIERGLINPDDFISGGHAGLEAKDQHKKMKIEYRRYLKKTERKTHTGEK